MDVFPSAESQGVSPPAIVAQAPAKPAFTFVSRLGDDSPALVQIVGPANISPELLGQRIQQEAIRAVAAKNGNHTGATGSSSTPSLPSVA